MTTIEGTEPETLRGAPRSPSPSAPRQPPLTLAQDAAPAKAAVCAACHGPAGKSTDPMYPILAGQTSRYLYLELRDFQEGRRSDPQMSPMAVDLTRDEMRELVRLLRQAEAAAADLQGRSGEGQARPRQGRRDAVHDVPSRRLRRPERDPAGRRPALRLHRQAAVGLQGAQAHQRRRQHDQRREHAERRRTSTISRTTWSGSDAARSAMETMTTRAASIERSDADARGRGVTPRTRRLRPRRRVAALGNRRRCCWPRSPSACCSTRSRRAARRRAPA